MDGSFPSDSQVESGYKHISTTKFGSRWIVIIFVTEFEDILLSEAWVSLEGTGSLEDGAEER